MSERESALWGEGRGGGGNNFWWEGGSSVCHVFFSLCFADRIHEIYRSSMPDSAEAVTVNLDANAEMTHVRIIQRMDRYQGTFKCEQCESVFTVSVFKRKKRNTSILYLFFFAP